MRAGESGETQKQLTAFAGYKLMGVGQYSKNKSAALEFAEYYTNKENQVRRFKDRGFVPTNKEAREENDVQSDACATAIGRSAEIFKNAEERTVHALVAHAGVGQRDDYRSHHGQRIQARNRARRLRESHRKNDGLNERSA